MTQPNATCLSCKHATPSESIRGMLWCLQNVGAGTLRGMFTYKPFHLPTTRPACGIYVKRETPLELPEPLVVIDAAEPPLMAEPTVPTVATPARRKDEFPKEFFL